MFLLYQHYQIELKMEFVMVNYINVFCYRYNFLIDFVGNKLLNLINYLETKHIIRALY